MSIESLSDKLKRINLGRLSAQEFVRKHQKGKGGVGFGDINPDPLVIENIEIVGNPVQVVFEEGTKTITPMARILTKSDGSIQVISGGFGAHISESDAKKVLPKSSKIQLTKSLKIKTSVK